MLTRHATVALLVSFALSITNAHAEIDPPGRVAWLDYLEGSASLAPAGGTDWVSATLNRPLTSGDSLWVDSASRSELYIGSTALRLGAQTSLRFAQLDDDTLQLDLRQGSLALRVRNLFDGQLLEIDTPNIALTINRPGEYRIDVAPDANTTTVSSWQGDSTARGDGLSEITLRGTQQTVFTGTQLRQLAVRDQPRIDDFDRWVASRDTLEDQSVSARYVSRELTGYQVLDRWGSWRDEPEYGAVWTPRITVVNWAPYRFGHWVWIAPWGWTWVDDQPWGFAPFHYGRWARLHDRWCWVPGKVTPRPVYAPALVAFANGSNVGNRTSHVSWVPLAPGELYQPHFTASPRYVSRINQTLGNIRQALTSGQTANYINERIPHAVSTVSSETFIYGRNVQHGNPSGTQREVPSGRFGIAPAIAPVAQSSWGNARPTNRPPPAVVLGRELIVAHPHTGKSDEVPASHAIAPAAETPAAARTPVHAAPEQPAAQGVIVLPPQVHSNPQAHPNPQAQPNPLAQPIQVVPSQIVPQPRPSRPANNPNAEAIAPANPAPSAVIRPNHPRIEPQPEPVWHKPATPPPVVVPAQPVAPAVVPAPHRPEAEIRHEAAPAPGIRPNPLRRDNEEQPAGNGAVKERRQNESPGVVPDAEARKRLLERTRRPD